MEDLPELVEEEGSLLEAPTTTTDNDSMLAQR